VTKRRQWAPQVHQQFKANFAAIDADKDGGLSMQELGAAMEQMQQQGGRGR
jgi:Ca2+-binding EF-hand superfamily protein